MPDSAGNGWSRYEERVLSELERLATEQAETRKCVTEVKVQLATIRTEMQFKVGKTALWGLLGGALPTIGMMLFLLLRGMLP